MANVLSYGFDIYNINTSINSNHNILFCPEKQFYFKKIYNYCIYYLNGNCFCLSIFNMGERFNINGVIFTI